MMSIVGETILNLSCIELSMSLSIATNISALNASRHLGQSSNMLDSVYRRLSSGLRINSAADDAAGLQISNRLTSEVNGTNTAIRNANDGISVINVADGALDESVNLMQRMRTLALQSGSGVNTAEDRVALNAEFKQLQLEMDRIATGTRFAGQDLLAGSYEGIFLVGAYAGQNTVITDLNAQTKNLGEMEWQARSPAGSKPGAYDIADLKLSSQPITLMASLLTRTIQPWKRSWQILMAPPFPIIRGRYKRNNCHFLSPPRSIYPHYPPISMWRVTLWI
ncbi:hypothetical protein ACEUDE_10205 [Aeromonas veronii]